jgi:hypothetical protein
VVTYSGTQSVETREAAYLVAVDGFAWPLLTANGGPWDVLQAFYARTPGTQKTQCYVWAAEVSDERVGGIRIRPTYQITLSLHWPLRQTTSPLAEQEQQAFKNAVDLLLQRIRGPVNDKSHGGEFLSAGEVPRSPGVHVMYEHPAQTIPADKELRATITYFADDWEINA